MAISNIKIVSIIGVASAIDSVVMACGKSQVFHPDDAMYFYSKMKNFTPYTDKNQYLEPLKKLQKIVARAEKNLELVNITDFDVTIKEINEYIEYFYDKLQKLLDSRKEKIAKIEAYKRNLEKIKHFTGLSVDLSEIAGCQYIKARFGRLPLESLKTLESYKDNPYILFFPCTNDNEYCYGMYFTPVEEKVETDRIFAKLYFERIKISDKNGTVEEKINKIQTSMQEEEASLDKVNKKIDSFWEAQKDQCHRFYTKLKELETYSGIKKYASKYKDNFILVGWIPEENETEFSSELDKIYGIEYSFDKPDSSLKHAPPVKLKNNWFSRPYEQFIEMYGLPEYKEFDPTNLAAIIYTIIYGIMFGDLGHGIVLALAGAWLAKRKRFSLGPIMVRCGFSACIFGTLFGSFFGFEHVLDPFYKNVFGLKEKPINVMEQIMPIVIASVALGVIILVISMIARVHLAAKLHDIESLFFSPNGIAGLVFYIALIAGVALQVGFNIKILNPTYVSLLIVLPLILIFLKEPLAKLVSGKKDWQPESWGGYITQNIFEMITVILEYVLNTVSFLRVGAYILVHAGLMEAVFICANLAPNPILNTIILIFGNLLVIVIEGLLVGIQTLRLEFYEMFSRIFEGSGQPFRPVVSPGRVR